MDEVHYLADRFRGAVWEEVIIHLPESVRLVSLSATVQQRRGVRRLAGDRPRGHRRRSSRSTARCRCGSTCSSVDRLYDLFADAEQPGGDEVNPRAGPAATRRRAIRPDVQAPGACRSQLRPARHRRRDAPRARRIWAPSPVRRRRAAGPRGPAAGDHVHLQPGRLRRRRRPVPAAGLRLTTPDERAGSATSSRSALPRPAGRGPARARLPRLAGRPRARHRRPPRRHAADASRRSSRSCSPRGLVKVVFATETLALGINMPARSVVLEKLVKWNGETHADSPPGEYTQLTGRAGRRGIDVEGHAVVLWHAGAGPRAVAGLASTRTYPLRSSFRPSYNMAVNLVGHVGPAPRRGSCWSRRSPSSRPTGRWSGWPARSSATRRPSRATRRR